MYVILLGGGGAAGYAALELAAPGELFKHANRLYFCDFNLLTWGRQYYNANVTYNLDS